MVTVGGRPILWHIMKGYAHHGYTHFILCLGYKGQMIKDYFLNHRLLTTDFRLSTASNDIVLHDDETARDNFHITFADTGEDTLTGERLRIASKYISPGQFMLTYGDGVSDIDLAALHAHHDRMRQAHGIVGTVTGVHPRSKYGLVETNEHGVITVFRQKPMLKDYTNGGFMVFEKEGVLPYLRDGEMIEDAMMRMAQEGKLSLYNYDGFWHCMDTYEDMKELNTQWTNQPKWKVWG